MSTFSYPYPVMLKRTDWNKQKGLIAKNVAGQTGIGAQCDKLSAAYLKIDWQKLNAFDRLDELGKWGGQNANVNMPAWNALCANARTELPKLAKVSKEAGKLRDLCIRVAKDFRESKTIPAKAATHVLAMAKAADKMSDDLALPAMDKVFDRFTDEFVDYIRATYIHPSFEGARQLPNKYANLTRNLAAHPTVDDFNRLTAEARYLTTVLGNLAKAQERGFLPRDQRAQQLFDALDPYADPAGSSAFFPAGTPQQKVLGEITKFNRAFDAALDYLRSVH